MRWPFSCITACLAWVAEAPWPRIPLSLAQTLPPHLQVHPTLASLNLAFNNITAEGLAPLCEALQCSAAAPLAALDLSGNPLGNRGGLLLAALLSQGSPLRSLSLRQCDLGEKGVIGLCTSLLQNPTNQLEVGKAAGLRVRSASCALAVSPCAHPRLGIYRECVPMAW